MLGSWPGGVACSMLPSLSLHALLAAGARPAGDGALLVRGVPILLLGVEPGVAVHVVRDALPPGAALATLPQRRLLSGSERRHDLWEPELVLFKGAHESTACATASRRGHTTPPGATASSHRGSVAQAGGSSARP